VRSSVVSNSMPNAAVSAITSHSGQCQRTRATTKNSSPVTVIVPVTAMP
jgi:hypothetical protein